MMRIKTLIKKINDTFKNSTHNPMPEFSECCLETDNGEILVHTENGHYILDYYGEVSQPGWIDPRLAKIIEKSGWEYGWEHPGAIRLIPVK